MGGKCSSHQKDQPDSTTKIHTSLAAPKKNATETHPSPIIQEWDSFEVNSDSAHTANLNQFIDSNNTLIPSNIAPEEKPLIHPDEIRVVCSLPNNQLAIGGGTIINIWDLKTNKKIILQITAKWSHNGETKKLFNLCLVNDYLIADCFDTFCIWNIKDWNLVKEIHSGSLLTSMCAIPTNPLLMSIGSSLFLRKENGKGGTRIINIEKLIKSDNDWYHKEKKFPVITEFGPNYEKGSIHIKHITLANKRLAVAKRVPIKEVKEGDKFEPANYKLEVSLWDYETGKPLGKLPIFSECASADFCELANGGLIVIPHIKRDHTAQIWDLNRQTCIGTLDMNDNVGGSSCLLSNNTLATSHEDNINLWSLKTLKHIQTIPIKKPSKLHALSNEQFACVMEGNKVQIFTTIYSSKLEIEKFTNFISTEPNNAQHYLYRAQCYYNEGSAQLTENIKFENWQNALNDWKNVEQLQSNLLMAPAIVECRNKAITEIALYQKKLEAENERARQAEEKKQQEHQEAKERQAAASRLQQAGILFESAIGKFHAEQFSESIADFDESLNLNPANKSIFYHRGLAKAGFKQHEAAIKDFNQRLVDYLKLSKEERAELFYARGLSKVALNNLDEAEKDYQNTLKENERHPHVNDALRKLTQLREQQEREKQQRAWSYQSQASSNAGPTTLFSPNAAPAITEEDRAKIEALKQQMRSQQHGM